MRYVNCENYSKEILDEVKQNEYNKYFAIVSVGDDPASQSYIKGKIKDCEYCGIPYMHQHIDLNTEKYPEIALEYKLRQLACDPEVSSIILQLPLPAGWDEKYFLKFIPPHKDVDGLTRDSKFSPCTPEGIVYIIKKELGELVGKTALIIGRGELVGRPLFDMLLKENCTVTIAHSKTKNLESMLSSYDIIVVAVGKPNLVDLSKCNAQIVIDVGVNRVDGKLCGDCFNFDASSNDNMLVTPVPKGIGLMTRAMLMQHVCETQKEV